MNRGKIAKAGLIAAWVATGFLFLTIRSFSKPQTAKTSPAVSNSGNAADYVGSEACKTCHEPQFAWYSKTAHARAAHVETSKMQGCESCHGPGRLHVESGGDKTKIRTFEGESAKQVSENCLNCHAGKEEHNNYKRGQHWRNDVACTACHTPHGEIIQPAQSVQPSSEKYLSRLVSSDAATSLRMLKDKEPQLCMQCHSEMKAQFSMPFHHRVPEGAMRCSDCHNPHGGFELRQTRLVAGADAVCIKCHTDKQGPFVFEHAPLKIEGCTICHTPHGSNNPKLLTRSAVRQLCLECHSNTGTIGIPNTPSFHNLAEPIFQNCTICHVKIHGSQVNQFFFR
jgi:predicted CXXCH cytochrome family protein